MTDHLNDAQLVRLIDGPGEHGDAEGHVNACSSCRSRLSALQHRSARFSGLLRETDYAVPDLELPVHTGVSRPILIAATLTMLFGASLFVQPVRAWILAQGRAVWERVTPETTAISETVVSNGLPDSASTSGVSFRPRSSTLSIQVSVWQAEGSITIRRGAGRDVTASVINAGEDDGIAVLPSGLRIENTIVSDVAYVITIPGDVTEVEVTVAGDSVTRLFAGDEFNEQSVDIARRPG